MSTAVPTGRRRRAAALALASAAVLAAAVITVVALLPGPPPPTPPAAQARVTDGDPVTDAGQLLGNWLTVQLDGSDVRTVRVGGGRPLYLQFERSDKELRWGANDVVNFNSGSFSVSAKGRFSAELEASTAAGHVGSGPDYHRNPGVVEQATEARLVADPRKLLLITGDQVLGVYTPG